MTNRKKLMQILDKPVFQEGKDPLEAVADYLLENDVVPVVRCKDCIHRDNGKCPMEDNNPWYETDDNGFCSCGERRDENAKP